LTLNISVPANTEATIHLPAAGTQTIRESGRLLSKRGSVHLAARDDHRAVVLVGSSQYQFSVT
jgi:alpha-L-rhamnosidase